MSPEEKAQLHAEIEKNIAQIEGDIADYKDMTQPVAPDVAIGRISRMDAINNKSITEYALREAQQKLSRLKMALGRIKSPEFGRCSRCKGQIPFGRLMLMPESTRCVRCS